MRSVLIFVAMLSPLLAETPLGKPLALSSQTPIAEIQSHPDQYVGKAVQVRGKVTEVCQMMGCWTLLRDPDSKATIRVKVNDGEIVFPKDAAGKVVRAEGKLVRLELSREQAVARARHEAEEQGRRFDPATVKSGAVIHEIRGFGAVIE